MEQAKNLLKEIKEDAELQSINGGNWLYDRYVATSKFLSAAWGGNMDCGGKDFYKKTSSSGHSTGGGCTRR